MSLFILSLCFVFFCNLVLFAQQKVADTTQINKLLSKADFFFKGKKYDSAIFYYETVNPIIATFGSKKTWIDKQIFLGICYINTNKFEKAKLFFEENSKQSISHLGEDNELTAKNYYYLGNSYWKLSDTKNTLSYYKKSLAIREKVLGLWHDDVALSYQNLGVVYRNMANYEDAIELYLKALAIREKTQGTKSAGVAAIYNNMGLVYKDWSAFEEAILYYNKSLHIKKQLYGEMHEEVAGTYSNIAGIYYHRQDYENSLLYHIKSLQIREKILPIHDIDIGASYENIGQVYVKMGNITAFFEYQHKSLWITQKKLGFGHRYNADAYLNLSNGHLIENQTDSAKIYAEKALQIYKKLYPNKHYFIASTYLQKSFIAQKEKNISQALAFCQQSLVENMLNFDYTAIEKHPMVVGEQGIMRIKDLQEAMILKGRLLLEQYQATKEEKYLNIGFQNYIVLDSMAQKLLINFSNENEKLLFNRKMTEGYKDAIAICFILSELRHKEFYTEKSFYFSERSKGAVLNAALTNTKAKKFAQIPDSLVQKERSLNNLLAKTEEKLLLEQNTTKNTEKISQLIDEFFELKDSHHQLMLSFEKKYPNYFSAKYNVKITNIATIQSNLDKNTAMISYTIADTCLYVFTITKNSHQFTRVKKSSFFDTQIKALLNSIYYQVGSVYAKSAYVLQQQLIPTNLPHRIKNIIFIPEGSLLKLPFEALLSKPFKGNFTKLDYTKLSYLVKNFTISYHYSATLFDENQQNKMKDQYKASYVAFAPIFTNESETNFLTKGCERAFYVDDEMYLKDSLNKATFLKDLEPTVLEELKDIHQDTSRAFDRSGKFIAPIPKTKDEVEGISQLHKNKNLFAKYYLFKDAKEEVIKSGELKNYSYIHFATHGFVNENLPELSGLLLSQDTLSKEDGVLYVSEIYNLDLSKAELITLSACETGLGKIATGEGVLGLSRAFLYAGAKNLIVSLWKVADSSASALMLEFYNNLLNDEEQKKNKSLRDAKLRILKNTTFAKPYYWSPFVLIGK